MSTFDYGKTRPDGQHERYPTQQDGGYVAPIRNSYVHDKCGIKTMCGDDIAETYAKHPNYYTRTFCVRCGNHYPIAEFRWSADDVRLGEISGEPGKDLREAWPKYRGGK